MIKTWPLIILPVWLLTLPALCSETYSGAGATFPFPIYSAWAFKYRTETGVLTNYQAIGSGGGILQVTDRTVDFGASDEPQTPAKLKEAGLLQFPAVVGGIALVFNVAGISSHQLKLDSVTLCGIFLGTIQKWSDPKIKALNAGLTLPEEHIEVIHRSDSSGSTAILTHYLSEVCSEWKHHVGEGKVVKFPTGIGAKGNGGIANIVPRTPNALGYVEFAYAVQNKLAVAKLKNTSGSFVAPSIKAFQAAAQTSLFDHKESFNAWLTNASGKESWPIAGATFILLPKEKKITNQKLIKFFAWSLAQGDKTAEELDYAPLPDSIKELVRDYWKANDLASRE